MKIINYLTIFKPTRYLIKMVSEIIKDIKSFLIILFAAIFAYAQINYSLNDEIGIDVQLKASYGIAFGDLGDYKELPYVDTFMFTCFSFFIPLVLLNMLIAIMADSYTRVQTNAIAADTRSLAELQLEYEEFVNFYLDMFVPDKTKSAFYYCFCSTLDDDDDGDEGWEGTVGQLKNTIQEQSAILEAKVIASMTEVVKSYATNIVDTVIKVNQ